MQMLEFTDMAIINLVEFGLPHSQPRCSSEHVCGIATMIAVPLGLATFSRLSKHLRLIF
jgi:hypothetical protein